LIYFGSTIQPICERKATHKTQNEAWLNRGRKGYMCASSIILEKGDDWILTPLRYILTDDKKTELLELENEYIQNNDCVNKNQAIQSAEDLREYKRKWIENKRRENGIEPKNKEFDAKKYARDWARAKRAQLTPEEREEINKKKREARVLKKEKV
jgi:hypothetical protein